MRDAVLGIGPDTSPSAAATLEESTRRRDDSQTLLDPLWIREAWKLDPVGDDLPPRLIATPEPESARDEASHQRWTDLWPSAWAGCVAQAAEDRDPSLIEQLQAAPAGSPGRAALLEQLFGPSPRDIFGEGAYTRSHEVWEKAQFEERVSPARLHREPEREQLVDLIPAWQAGLTTLVVIPCEGSYTRRIGGNALMLTEQSRFGTDYGQALQKFTAR